MQVNLDFSSEADMVDKMRLGIALQPIATALFANSPFRNGVPTGYISWRSHVWTDTDPDRRGPCLQCLQLLWSFLQRPPHPFLERTRTLYPVP